MLLMSSMQRFWLAPKCGWSVQVCVCVCDRQELFAIINARRYKTTVRPTLHSVDGSFNVIPLGAFKWFTYVTTHQRFYAVFRLFGLQPPTSHVILYLQAERFERIGSFLLAVCALTTAKQHPTKTVFIVGAMQRAGT